MNDCKMKFFNQQHLFRIMFSSSTTTFTLHWSCWWCSKYRFSARRLPIISLKIYSTIFIIWKYLWPPYSKAPYQIILRSCESRRDETVSASLITELISQESWQMCCISLHFAAFCAKHVPSCFALQWIWANFVLTRIMRAQK